MGSLFIHSDPTNVTSKIILQIGRVINVAAKEGAHGLFIVTLTYLKKTVTVLSLIISHGANDAIS